jgi:hypothetical protein
MCYIFFLITELNRPQQNKTKQKTKKVKFSIKNDLISYLSFGIVYGIRVTAIQRRLYSRFFFNILQISIISTER